MHRPDLTVSERRKLQAQERLKQSDRYKLTLLAATRKYAAKKIDEGLCRACGQVKEDEKTQHCNKCRDRRRSSNLKRLYGVTAEEYEQLAAEQDYVCWICKSKVTSKKGNLLVDHSHKTGMVRGLLCTRCNLGLGGFGDSIEKLERAIKYLREFAD